MDGEPVQILVPQEKEDKIYYHLKEDLLTSILEECGDCFISIISIAGASRRGKSSFMNLYLQYLLLGEDNWHEKPDELREFKYSAGTDAQTRGLWIWSKPIIKKQKAIILMDSQGLFDNHTNTRDCTVLLGIPLLTSSLLIFNVFNDIQQDKLSYLEIFSSDAKKANDLSDNKNNKFQKLLFLIRDWQNDQQFDFGADGGQEYLDSQFSITNKANQRTVKFLKQSFEKINCFLLPRPKDLSKKLVNDETFAEIIEGLFTSDLSANNVPFKTMNNQKVKARHFIEYFRLYVKLFNSGDAITSLDFFEARAKAADYIIIKEFKENFIKTLDESILFDDAEFRIIDPSNLLKVIIDKKKEVFSILQDKLKSKDKTSINETMSIFESEINTFCENKYQENQSRINLKIECWIKDATSILEKDLYKLVGNYSKEAQVFDHISNLKFNEIEADFLTVFSKYFSKDDNDFKHQVLKVRDILNNIVQKFRQQNNHSFVETKSINDNVITNVLTQYTDVLSQYISQIKNDTYVTKEMLKNYSNAIKNDLLSKNLLKLKGEQGVLEELQLNLEEKVDNKYDKIENQLFNYQEELRIKTEIYMKESCTKYHEEIDSSKLLKIFGLDEFRRRCDTIQKNILIDFENNCLKDPNFIHPYKNQLINAFNKINKENETNILGNKNKSYNDFAKLFLKEFEECELSLKSLFDENSITEFNTFKKDIMDNFANSLETSNTDVLDELIADAYKALDYNFDETLSKIVIELYNSKINEEIEKQDFFSRKELENIHKNESVISIEIFNNNHKNSDTYLLEHINVNIQGIYRKAQVSNQNKREAHFKEYLISIIEDFKSEIIKFTQKVSMNDVQLQEKSSELKKIYENKLKNKYFRDGETDIYASFSERMQSQLDLNFSEIFDKNKMKIDDHIFNFEKVKDDSLKLYRDKMKKLLDKGKLLSIQSFVKKNEKMKDKSVEAFNNFAESLPMDLCEDIKTRFLESLTNESDQLKSYFSKMKDKKLELIDIKISSKFGNYQSFMEAYGGNLTEKATLAERHSIEKIKNIDEFKKVLRDELNLDDINFIDEQTKRLENMINSDYEKSLEKIKISNENLKSKFESIVSIYTNGMEAKIKVNIDSENLDEIHSQLQKKCLEQFDKDFNETTNKDKYKNLLNTQILDIYSKSKQLNIENREKRKVNEMKINLAMKNIVEEYKKDLPKFLENKSDDNEQMNAHLNKSKSIVKDFMILQQIKDSEMKQTLMTKLQLELNSIFDEIKENLNLKHKQMEHEINESLNKARLEYKNEMETLVSISNFIDPEKLNDLHKKLLKRLLSSYEKCQSTLSKKDFEDRFIKNIDPIFKEFYENNAMNASKTPAIGIDLGTSHSCVAYFKPMKPEGKIIIIPNDMGENTTPSIVGFNPENNEILIGTPARTLSYSNPQNTIFGAKRLIGKKFSDKIVKSDMQMWPFNVVDDGKDIPNIQVRFNKIMKNLYPEQISSKILRSLKNSAEKHLNHEVKNAVITVPAYFNESQKQATKDAGKIAGLNVLKIINEPTAAALAYQLNNADFIESRKIVVFDFGGGTLDVVVLESINRCINIIAVGGDNHLGGEDLDQILVKYCEDSYFGKRSLEQSSLNKESDEYKICLRRLTTACCDAKKQLSASESVIITIENFQKNSDLKINMTRNIFERISNKIFVQAINIVKSVVADSGIKIEHVDEIVLVGGTTRIPKIREMLSELFLNKQLNYTLNPDEAVAIGAAIHAAVLNGAPAQNFSSETISDVAPFSLGIEVGRNQEMSIIIHKNSRIPDKITKDDYCTQVDYQERVAIRIYEGESSQTINNRFLGSFDLTNLPKKKAGEVKISVTFEITNEGIIKASAKLLGGHWPFSSKQKGIEIKENKGTLTVDQIEEFAKQEAGMKL